MQLFSVQNAVKKVTNSWWDAPWCRHIPLLLALRKRQSQPDTSQIACIIKHTYTPFVLVSVFQCLTWFLRYVLNISASSTPGGSWVIWNRLKANNKNSCWAAGLVFNTNPAAQHGFNMHRRCTSSTLLLRVMLNTSWLFCLRNNCNISHNRNGCWCPSIWTYFWKRVWELLRGNETLNRSTTHSYIKGVIS